VCSECGGLSSKWSGQCGDCGSWNTLSEMAALPVTRGGRQGGYSGTGGGAPITRLDEVSASEQARNSTGMEELDRVLGGGVVEGSAILIGGDPGIGKSTLLLQVMATLGAKSGCLYVTGEESLQQVAMRGQRLGIDAATISCIAETGIERILTTAEQAKPKFIVIDSIQTVYSENLQSAPGSVSQVRDCAAMLVRFAKTRQCSVLIVGHVTKEGGIAGPRVLEHMVDTVLYFEGDSGSRYRMIRALKNRFGAANELGVFAMLDQGLKPVANPSAIFLSGRSSDSPGSAVMVAREGTRPMLVEIQALVAQSHLGNPRRVSVGLDNNRLAMLLAVLQRQSGLVVHDQDVFLNAVGGIRIAETAGDLAILLGVASSLINKALPDDYVVFGEVGLAGEVRPVPNGDERLKEAAKHGFKGAVIPAANQPKSNLGMKLLSVKTVSDAVEWLS